LWPTPPVNEKARLDFEAGLELALIWLALHQGPDRIPNKSACRVVDIRSQGSVLAPFA